VDFATDKDNNRFRWDGNDWVKAEFAYDQNNQEFVWDGADWSQVNTEAQDFADEKYGEQQAPAPLEGQQQNGFGDFIDQTKAAFVESYGADAAAVRILTGSETAGAVEDYLYDVGEEARSTLSADAREAQGKTWLSDKEGETFGEAWGDIDSWISLGASGAGSLGALIAGGGIVKAAASIGLRGLGKKIVKDSATDRNLTIGTYGALEGGMVGGSAGRAVEEEILRMPNEVLVESEGFQDVFQELINEGYSESEAADQGKKIFARSTAQMVVVGGGTAGIVLGTVAGKYLDDALRGQMSGGLAGLPKNVAIQTGVQGGTEAAQGGSQKFAENLGIQQADSSQDLMEGVAEAAVAEGLAGGLMGAPVGALGSLNSPVDLTVQPDPDPFSDVEIPDVGLVVDEFGNPVEPAGELPAPEVEPEVVEPDFVVTPSGMAAESQTDIDQGQERMRAEAESDVPLIETTYQPDPDMVVNSQGEVMTPAEQTQVDLGMTPNQLAIENQNIIYGEGPVRDPARNDALEEEFPQGYNVETYEGGAEFKPLKDINITQQFNLEDSGETVEVSERADRLFSKIDKRRNVLTKLLECVG
jgi:hypothetical protein